MEIVWQVEVQAKVKGKQDRADLGLTSISTFLVRSDD